MVASRRPRAAAGACLGVRAVTAKPPRKRRKAPAAQLWADTMAYAYVSNAPRPKRWTEAELAKRDAHELRLEEERAAAGKAARKRE